MCHILCCCLAFCRTACAGPKRQDTIAALALRNAAHPHAQDAPARPRERKVLGEKGHASEFVSYGQNIFDDFPELRDKIHPTERKDASLQLFFSSKGASATPLSEPRFPPGLGSDINQIDYTIWYSWSYTKGYHAAFFLVGATRSSFGQEGEKELESFIRNNKNARCKYNSCGLVIVSGITTCVTYTEVFIEAESAGCLFIGFKPYASGPDQWKVVAPPGTYCPYSYPYELKAGKQSQYFPLFAMRSVKREKLPVAPLGFEPDPRIAGPCRVVMSRSTDGGDTDFDFSFLGPNWPGGGSGSGAGGAYHGGNPDELNSPVRLALYDEKEQLGETTHGHDDANEKWSASDGGRAPARLRDHYNRPHTGFSSRHAEVPLCNDPPMPSDLPGTGRSVRMSFRNGTSRPFHFTMDTPEGVESNPSDDSNVNGGQFSTNSFDVPPEDVYELKVPISRGGGFHADGGQPFVSLQGSYH